MQYNNNRTPFSAYSNQNNKKILDAIDELQEEVDTLSSSLDGVSSSLASKADAQTTASDIQTVAANVSSLSNALTSLRDDIKSGNIGKIDDINVDNILVNDKIQSKGYEWKEGEELSINKVLVPKNGSIYFVYSSFKTALIQYNTSNDFIVISSSNGFVKYGTYNNDLAFTVSESSYINYIGDIFITAGNITGEVLTKTGTTIVGDLYASLQEANIENLTVTNISANVIVSDDVRADNITADSVTADDITADSGDIKELDSDLAKVKELNTSQINTKVDIENIGYTIIPEHQSGTDYLVVVPETNGTWNIELPGYFKATIVKVKDAAVITYNRTSTVALSKIEVKNGKLYFFTEGYGKLYFANDSLENDNTVATYTENPPYTEPDETLELTSNNGTVNTTRAYFNNVTIYGSMSIRDYSADKINTSKNDTDATFYPTFVDSNNENEDAEKLYTSTNLSLNPYEGKITICSVCATDCVNTSIVNADLVCADICSDVINTTSLNSTTITNTGNVGTCTLNVTDCATIRNLNVTEQTETGSIVVNNDAFIKGDLWVDGTTHTVDEETVTTQSDTIVLRANNDTSLGNNLSGIVINKYNGTDDLGIVTDSDGTLRVGTGTGTETSYPAISYNSTTNKWYTDPTDPTTEVTPVGNLTSWATKTEDGPYTNYTNAVFTVFDKTSLEPVMTRDESTNMTNGQIVCWDSTGNKAKTTNCISDNVTFAKCVDVECNLTVDGSICACNSVNTPVVNATCANVSCCLTACNAMFNDSVTICCDLRVCGSAIIHGLTSDCMAVQENTSNHNMYPTFVCRNNAQQQGELMFTDCDLYYNPFTNTLVSTNLGFNIARGDNVIADGAISCFCGICTRYDINMYEDDWNYHTGYIYCDGSGCWNGAWSFCCNVYVDKYTHMNGPLIISATNAAGNFDEGIRINSGTAGYATLTIGTTGDCGGSTGFWIGTNCCNNENKLFINYHNSTCNSYFQGNSDGTTTWHGNVDGTASYSNKARILDADGSTLNLGSDSCIGAIWGSSAGDSYGICTTDWRNYISVSHGNYNNYYGLSFAMPFWEYQRFAWRVRNNGNLCPIHELIDDRGGQRVAGALCIDVICPSVISGQCGQSRIEYTNTSFCGYTIHDNQTCALYIESREAWSGDSGGIAITNDGITAFGSGDVDGVFRVVNEDNVGAGAVFRVYKDGVVTASSCFYSSNINAPVLRNDCQSMWLGENSIALGKASWNNAISYNVSIGYCATTDGGANNIAIGPQAKAPTDAAIAIGPNTCASSRCSVAIGTSTCATCECSIAIGFGTQASRPSSIAIGCGAYSIGQFATAIGPSSTTYRESSVAIGNSAKTSDYGNAIVDFCVKTAETRLKTVSWYCGTMQCDIFRAIADGVDLTWVGGCDIPENDVNFATIGTFGNHEVSRFRFDKNESPRNIDFITNGQDTFCTIYEGCTATVSRPGMILVLGSR